jgi:hypothetical protein
VRTWKPLERSIYHSFVGRSEVIWSRRDQLNGLQSASGLYVSGDYKVGRRWFTGVRFDRSAHATDASLTDTGGSFGRRVRFGVLLRVDPQASIGPGGQGPSGM